MGPRWRLRAHQGRQRTERAGWALNPGSPRSPCTGCAEHTKDILSKLTAADPADLAFLAMTHYQLGHKQEAKAILTRMQATMKLPRWADNVDAKAFLREAEALLQGQSGKTATK